MYGPMMGAASAMISDIIGHFLRPTGPFFIGFTVSSILAGFIYGIFLYQEKISPKRVFFCYMTINIFVNIILNTLWLKILYNRAILAFFPARLIKTAVCFFPNYILLLTVLSVLVKVLDVHRKK
jgi:ECF transporter S component (folate family)